MNKDNDNDSDNNCNNNRNNNDNSNNDNNIDDNNNNSCNNYNNNNNNSNEKNNSNNNKNNNYIYSNDLFLMLSYVFIYTNNDFNIFCFFSKMRKEQQECKNNRFHPLSEEILIYSR